MKIPTILDLQAIQCKENGEVLVSLHETNVLCDYQRKNSGLNTILVRKSIGNKIQKIQERLTLYDEKMRLLIVEGYRSPVYQERYYLKELLTQYGKNPKMNFEDFLEKTHQLVALPSVAGHPTGGAVDLTIACEGKEIDMGGKIADFTIPGLLPTYSSLTTLEQKKNRLLLHDLMIEEGFAPFYGEWWHFSYGDREWAAFHDELSTLYAPLFL